MLESAEALSAAAHHRNACYLAGYVVECGLKAMLIERYRRVPGVRVPPYKVHRLQELTDLLTALALVADREVVKHGLPLAVAPTIGAQIGTDSNGRALSHWDPYHRYDGSRWVDSIAYVAEAKAVNGILDMLRMEGVLS